VGVAFSLLIRTALTVAGAMNRLRGSRGGSASDFYQGFRLNLTALPRSCRT